MQIGSKGINLIKTFEGFRANAYKCPANVWTIGYGHTVGVKKGDTITEEQAIELLKEDLKIYERAVIKGLSGIPVTSNQFDALVSFTYNVGAGAFSKSTLLRKIVQGRIVEAANEFPKWNKAAGKVLAGLAKRRAAERDLFLS